MRLQEDFEPKYAPAARCPRQGCSLITKLSYFQRHKRVHRDRQSVITTD